MAKEPLFGKTLQELEEWIAGNGLPRFTAAQMADWLYKKDIGSIDQMLNLSKAVREKLSAGFNLGLAGPASVSESSDGTKKYLFPAGNGKFVEAAYIPEAERATLCISTQVGCKMGCLFCMTGKQGFQGNLTSGEILNQIKSLPKREKLTNIVYMGMGEPLDNLENVLRSLEILTSGWGFGMSPRRITVSTIGLLPALRRFIEESEAHLAISLHSPFEDERKKLMPVENVFPLEKVLEVIRKYDFGRQRRISFEYIMFRGLNDTQRHVNRLAALLNGLRCRVNLIRFHPIPATPLQPSSEETLEKFLVELNRKGIRTTIRASRGQDISAACGMLSTKMKSHPAP
ncbi:MAG: 23S rRNA (adenine(2503)-C(2))-methyltransferase RlmN [Bacteroidales bacterium]|nr:23S rRNA (adenine(2503)-C(2))-methyltransferase RlmN [Bacteroidales bacterium]